MRLLLSLFVLGIVAAAVLGTSRPVEEIDAQSAPVDDKVVTQLGAVDQGKWGPPLTPESLELETIQPPDAASEQMSQETFRQLHQENDRGFRNAPGNGRFRGGAHVLMSEGAVVFLPDTIRPLDTSVPKVDEAGLQSEYGLWGALGTVASKTKKQSTGHSFQQLSKQHLRNHDADVWKAEWIQLVSVQNHWAYQDDELPTLKMLQDKSVGTRSLDAFELESISKLRGGEQLVIERSDDVIKMLGAIRAESDCLSCHTVSDGDLLGAFTYRFKPKD